MVQRQGTALQSGTADKMLLMLEASRATLIGQPNRAPLCETGTTVSRLISGLNLAFFRHGVYRFLAQGVAVFWHGVYRFLAGSEKPQRNIIQAVRIPKGLFTPQPTQPRHVTDVQIQTSSRRIY